MIRSTKVTLKYANQNKKETLATILNEYKKATQFFVDYLWENYPISTKIPTLLPKTITEQATTFLSKRMIQCCAKQASGIVRGCRKKFEKRTYILNKLNTEGKLKQARKLAHIIKTNPISKPEIKNIQAELDSRFVEIEYNKKTSFDGWINLGSIGNKLKLNIPINWNKNM
jgi:predicted transposase